MPHKVQLATFNANSGAWLQLDAAVNGTVSVQFYGESQNLELVCNATDATGAAAEKTANRYFKVLGGGVNTPARMDLNPSTTWLRSATATAGNVWMHAQW